MTNYAILLCSNFDNYASQKIPIMPQIVAIMLTKRRRELCYRNGQQLLSGYNISLH